VVSDTVRGESVTFKRVPNWWGDKKRYFQGMYNFDEIHLRIISPERELDYVRQGELDVMVELSSRAWNENYTFPAVTNGWLRRERVFLESPEGLYGLHLNLEAPIFRNKDFRNALEYLFNFDRLNRNLMYNEYFRLKSFFEGTEYADPDLKARTFDPVKAQELLTKAGFHRPREIGDQSFLGKLKAAVTGLIFTRSDTDDILVNDQGEKASFTLIYGGKSIERHLTVMQQDFRRAGVDLRLQLLEDGTVFERALERKYEMFLTAMTGGIYPEPRQYLHTDFKNSRNNNDFWGFGTPEVDALIKTYEESQDADARREALRRIDRIVYDEAMYIPFWTAPYMRLVHWDYIQFPDFYLPRRTQQLADFQVYWFDPEKKKALEEAMRTNTPYKVDPELDKDPYDVRKKFQ
ncbi:MAG: ABC transporter substrate-binding protein, partial [Rhodospirillaceae bacterium]